MIAITGASGQLGRQIAERLLATVDNPGQVVLSVRDPRKIDDLAQRGAVVRQADFSDPESLEKAYAGVGTLLIISGDAPVAQRIEQHRNAIAAAKTAGVARLVYTSYVDAEADSPFAFAAIHADTEAALRASGLAYSILRNNGYMELLLAALPQVQGQGVFAQPSGTGKASLVARADLAEATVKVLTQEGHANKTYQLSGPQALSGSEIAEHFSKALSRPVAFSDLPRADYEAALLQAGLPPFVAEAIGGLQEAFKQGRMGGSADDLTRLLGRPPLSLRAFLTRSLAAA